MPANPLHKQLRADESPDWERTAAGKAAGKRSRGPNVFFDCHLEGISGIKKESRF